MYKLVILPLLFAAVSAGVIGGHYAAPAVVAAPVAYAAPAVHAAPVVHAAPAVVAAPVVAKAAVPVATSYANVHQVSISHPVAAPVAVAPVAVAHAPAVVAHAPAIHAAPLALGHGYHG